MRLRYFVPAVRVPGATLAIVGEAPGAQEVVNKKPFVGPSGQLLDGLLKKAGIDRKAVTVTNVLKCNPKDNKLPDELELAVNCCSEILDKDLEDTKIVIGLGNVPLKAMTNQNSIMKRRGSIYPLHNGKHFIGTLHPSFLMRSQFVKNKKGVIPKEIVVADLEKAKRLSIEGVHIPTFEIVTDPSSYEMNEFLKRLQDPKLLVGVDIETTREGKAEHAVPTIIAFATKDYGICAEFDESLEFIAAALESPARKVFHNGAVFDIFVLEGVGFKVNNYYMDTMYAHHLAFSELKHSLGFVQSLYTDLPFHKDMADDEEMEDSWEK